jgi:hypothetical protein
MKHTYKFYFGVTAAALKTALDTERDDNKLTPTGVTNLGGTDYIVIFTTKKV